VAAEEEAEAGVPLLLLPIQLAQAQMLVVVVVVVAAAAEQPPLLLCPGLVLVLAREGVVV
jgi:hypothetical protein